MISDFLSSSALPPSSAATTDSDAMTAVITSPISGTRGIRAGTGPAGRQGESRDARACGGSDQR
ncbi:hypothetical protein ABZS83_32115, partial [Streptomyces sp. NPDC005426]|uniref:hypothetical protein n=1 Tax=Streptomyces sp. NPDC005426 TaxID=3155344 RepID=UPI0033B41BCD